MDNDILPVIEAAIRALECPNCRSGTSLKIQNRHLRCRNCSISYRIIDGVLDLMPPDYSGYPGDSTEAAALRDAHNRLTLHEETLHLRSTLNQLLHPEYLVLDAGCGTGRLASMIAESRPDVTIIATDVSLPMCRLAAKNCHDKQVLVVHTPTSKNPPMPFRGSVFDIVLNRLAPMAPEESFRLLRPDGRAVSSGFIDANWQEVRQAFPEERIITFPRDMKPEEALIEAGFSHAESHTWRAKKTRSLREITMVLRYAPILNDFDEAADRPLLRRLEEYYGDKEGIRLTEGEKLIIGCKGDCYS